MWLNELIALSMADGRHLTVNKPAYLSAKTVNKLSQEGKLAVMKSNSFL